MQQPGIEVKPCVKCGARDRCASGRCRPCKQEAGRRRYEANRDKIQEQHRRWHEANRDEVLERNRRYREANPEYHRHYYEANRDKVRERVRRWREANPEKVLEARRRWQEANPDKTREAKRRYREANPDVFLLAYQNRRARKRNPNYPDDRLSPGLKKKLMKLQGGRCAYANAPLAYWCAVDIRKENHMDHIMPLKLNGRNIDSNMQLTCPACNLHKSDSHPDDFARRVGLIV